MTISKFLLTTVLASMLPMAANATLTFETGNTGGIGEVNVLFDTPDTGTSILGQVDHTGIDVTFSSLTGQTLLGSGNGQADIVVAGPTGQLMTSIDMRAQAGTAWGDVILDLDAAMDACGGGSGTCGVAKITATDNNGQSFTTTIDNGTNFVTVQAVQGSGEVIQDIQVTMQSADPVTGLEGWIDFKQPRVSGLCTIGTNGCLPVSVPEPASLALLASGLLGLGLLIRRRRSR